MWSRLWQQVAQRLSRSRPRSPRPLDSPRDAGIRKLPSPRVRPAPQVQRHARPRVPPTAREYIDLLGPILSDSERLEEANRLLSAPGIPLELRFKAKRGLDVSSRNIRQQLNSILRTALNSQTKDSATALPYFAHEKIQQYQNVLTAFIRNNVHDLDPYHESIIVHDRLERASRRLTTHELPATHRLVDALNRKKVLLQHEQLKAAVYRVALSTCRRNMEKVTRELINLHAFNDTSVGTEPYGPLKPIPRPKLGGDRSLDQMGALMNRWKEAKINLATAEDALAKTEDQFRDVETLNQALHSGELPPDLKAATEAFADKWLKKHTADHKHLQEVTETFKQVRDEAMTACFAPVTVVYQDPSAKKMKLRGPVEVDWDVDEFLFHGEDELTDSEASQERGTKKRYHESKRPERQAWAANIVQQSHAVSSPPSQASINRRYSDAGWHCESVGLGESRSHIVHFDGDRLTKLRRLKIKAYREACEAERSNHQGHYPSIQDALPL